MKKILATLILLISFGFTSFAYAQDAVTDRVSDFRKQAIEDRQAAVAEKEAIKAELRAEAEATRTDFKAQLDAAETDEEKQAVKDAAAEAKQELRDDAAEIRDEWRDKVKEFFSNRVTNAFEKFGTFVEKAEAVDSRVDHALDKLEEQGVDTASVRALQAEAQTLIESVKETLRVAKANLETAVETGSKEEIRTAVNEAKEALTSAKTELKEAYGVIRSAIAELKQLLAETRSDVESENDETEDDDTTEESTIDSTEE